MDLIFERFSMLYVVYTDQFDFHILHGAFIGTIRFARWRSVLVFPGLLINKQDETCLFFIRPENTVL